MSKMFNVKFKIGKRSFSSKLYAQSYENILNFVNNNMVAQVSSIEEIVYEAPDSVNYPSDDINTYKGTFNFLVGNKDANKINKFILQTVKPSRSVNEVFDDFKNFLYLDKVSRADSLVSASISSK